MVTHFCASNWVQSTTIWLSMRSVYLLSSDKPSGMVTGGSFTSAPMIHCAETCSRHTHPQSCSIIIIMIIINNNNHDDDDDDNYDIIQALISIGLGVDCGVSQASSAKHHAVCKAHSAVLLSLAAQMAFAF